MGRLVELQFAEWLEALGWEIAGLEALGEDSDIEARRQRSQLTAFEVKFIGTDDVDFEVVRMSLKGESAAKAVSPYSATNYLLFRGYEAAKQLQKVKHARVALLVVDAVTGFRFEYGWIDWNDPRFFPGDQSWQEFLKRKRHRYSLLESDLRPTLNSVNAVWIVELSSGYKYDRKYEISIRGT